MSVRSFNLSNFQSFDDDGAGINTVKRINIVIGPNNSGKSKLLRASTCLAVIKSNLLSDNSHNFRLTAKFTLDTEIDQIYTRGAYSGGLPGNTHWDGFGKYIENIEIVADLSKGSFSIEEVDFSTPYDWVRQHFQPAERILRGKSDFIRSRVKSANWYYVAAERDIQPEIPLPSLTIGPNGVGVTGAITSVLNDHDKDSDLVEKHLLDDINEIAHPEYHYDRITVQKLEDDKWEIYLHDSKHGRVALSQCGSGIKTILHIASLFNIIIESQGSQVSNSLIVLEEIENSLHPRTQRSLLDYIDKKVGNDSVCIIATHSSTCLDYFQGRDDVSFTRIFQDEGITKSHEISAFVDRTGVLDALGVKASDALNSNCVIWVEGPSDRIYLKHLIDLLSDDELHEGQHYSVMFYGGKLLSHLTADDPQMVSELISLLKINRNSAILIDSDRKKHGGWVNETKRRIKNEAQETGAYVWTSQGREIENYFKPEFWASHMTVTQSEVGPYDQVFEAVKRKKPDGKTINTKVELARWATNHISVGDIALDGEARSKEVIKFIRASNYM